MVTKKKTKIVTARPSIVTRPSIVISPRNEGALLKKQTTIGSIESMIKSPRYSNSIIIPDGNRQNSPRKSAKNFTSSTIADWAESGQVYRNINLKDKMKSELLDDY